MARSENTCTNLYQARGPGAPCPASILWLTRSCVTGVQAVNALLERWKRSETAKLSESLPGHRIERW